MICNHWRDQVSNFSAKKCMYLEVASVIRHESVRVAGFQKCRTTDWTCWHWPTVAHHLENDPVLVPATVEKTRSCHPWTQPSGTECDEAKTNSCTKKSSPHEVKCDPKMACWCYVIIGHISLPILPKNHGSCHLRSPHNRKENHLGNFTHCPFHLTTLRMDFLIAMSQKIGKKKPLCKHKSPQQLVWILILWSLVWMNIDTVIIS